MPVGWVGGAVWNGADEVKSRCAVKSGSHRVASRFPASVTRERAVALIMTENEKLSRA